MNPVAASFPLLHYHWGTACEGWVLEEGKSLSVKLERMPPGTAEALHYHREARQFFYILEGVAHFEIDETVTEVKANEGLTVLPGQRHRVCNNGSEDLVFLLASGPAVGTDRINCSET